MKFKSLDIPDVKLIETEIFSDDRGYFFESFNEKKFFQIINDQIFFVQDNQSYSKANVLRGLHFQKHPMGQGKLIRVIIGEIFDVAVDLRKSSDTYGKWIGQKLTSDQNNQLWIPEGFAHGFYCLKDSLVHYKTTKHYSKKDECTIKWDDPVLDIDWPITLNPRVSQKDNQGNFFDKNETYF